jgi:hypothetical protein
MQGRTFTLAPMGICAEHHRMEQNRYPLRIVQLRNVLEFQAVHLMVEGKKCIAPLPNPVA